MPLPLENHQRLIVPQSRGKEHVGAQGFLYVGDSRCQHRTRVAHAGPPRQELRCQFIKEPCEVPGKRGGELHLFPGARMAKAELFGMEKLATERIY